MIQHQRSCLNSQILNLLNHDQSNYNVGRVLYDHTYIYCITFLTNIHDKKAEKTKELSQSGKRERFSKTGLVCICINSALL